MVKGSYNRFHSMVLWSSFCQGCVLYECSNYCYNVLYILHYCRSYWLLGMSRLQMELEVVIHSISWWLEQCCCLALFCNLFLFFFFSSLVQPQHGTFLLFCNVKCLVCFLWRGIPRAQACTLSPKGTPWELKEMIDVSQSCHAWTRCCVKPVLLEFCWSTCI